MSEYHNDPSYGRDDYGSTCDNCGAWFRAEWDDYCSVDCEDEARAKKEAREDPDGD